MKKIGRGLRKSLPLSPFFIGAVLAGIIIGDAHLRMGHRYGVALAIESGLLLISAYGFSKGLIYGEYFASMAAGLQNAMASTYSEAIVRTTHMTGILTDIGSLVGNKIRGIKSDGKRIKLLSIIFFSFILGGIVGAFSHHLFDTIAMLVPAVIIGVSSLGYEIFRRKMKISRRSL
ncbi:MAG TPA: YoaK family protein [Candidatus Omnitrophota bacterium]|nr:YoaK family protein [Candidatus Omnitrophota bacterium]